MRNRKGSLVTFVLLVASVCLVSGCILPPSVASGYEQVVEISGGQVIAALQEIAPNLQIGGNLETGGGGITVSDGLYSAWPLGQIVAKIREFACCPPPDCSFARQLGLVVADLWRVDSRIAVGMAATASDGYPPWFMIAVVYEYGSFKAYAIDLTGCVWDPRDCVIHEIDFY